MPDKTYEELYEAAMRIGVTDYMIPSLCRYILQGHPVGGFLYSVLTNNLLGACNKADDENKRKLYEFVFFLVNYAPAISWGSEEAVKNWSEVNRARRSVEARIPASENEQPF